MKRFDVHKWNLKRRLLEQEDPRRPKDIEFDNAQAMSRLTPDDRDKIKKVQQMMDKEGGNMSVSNKFDHSKFDFQEKVTKASFIYNEQSQKFYSLTLFTSDNKQIKLKYNEANSWLKDTLEYIHEGDLIPKHYSDGLEDLDLIVERLEELGIEASYNEYDYS